MVAHYSGRRSGLALVASVAQRLDGGAPATAEGHEPARLDLVSVDVGDADVATHNQRTIRVDGDGRGRIVGHAVGIPATHNSQPRLYRYLMCPPTFFEVTYRINPWMHPENPVDAARAYRQWRALRDELIALGHRIDLIPAQPGLPDMVYAANGAIVIDDKALIPRFRYAERQRESAHFADALAGLGITQVRQAECINEGEGDFLLVGDRILAGTGPRSDPAAPAEVSDFFAIPTIRLTLSDPRLYHLDTALAVLDADTIAYWPAAFDRRSRKVLRELYPDAVIASEHDASGLALNMVSDGQTVLMNSDRSALAQAITDRGYAVRAILTDELLKGGGGAKCCVLQHHRRLSTS